MPSAYNGEMFRFPGPFRWTVVLFALILPVAAVLAFAASPYVRKHWQLLLFAVVMFVLSFTPVPIKQL